MSVFVDLDGTLLDSRPRLHRLFCDLSGEAMDFDLYWSHKREGRSNQQLLAELYGREPGVIDRFTAGWMAAIESPPYLALDRPFDFAVPALSTLAAREPVWVLTARQDEAAARAQVTAAGFDPFVVDVLVTGGGIPKERLCRERGVTITAADRFIGDTGDDIALARAFGARAVAVCSGFRSREYLTRRNPDALHEDIGAYCRTL